MTDGDELGRFDGEDEAANVGDEVGDADRCNEGLFVVGKAVGTEDTVAVGLALGGVEPVTVGKALGLEEGCRVGCPVGAVLGCSEGLADGLVVGANVLKPWNSISLT